MVSDAVFSVDGGQAPVAGLHAVARDHEGLLVLDEAHSFGVIGPGGRGAAAAAGISAEPDLIRTVTLSSRSPARGRGAGGAGGSRHAGGHRRGFIFDTGLAPPCAGAALAALEVVAAEPELGARARAAATRLAGIAAALGLSGRPPDAAVLAVVVGDAARAAQFQRICAGHGVRAGCFRPPSVPVGQACLRLAARASLAESDFAAPVRALAAVRDHGDS